jgi:hypothetical protein
MAERTAFHRRSSSAVEMGVFSRSLGCGMSRLDPLSGLGVLTIRIFLHIVLPGAPQRGTTA